MERKGRERERHSLRVGQTYRESERVGERERERNNYNKQKMNYPYEILIN